MTKMDIILLIPIILGFFIGFVRGFVREIAIFAAILLGIFCSKWLSCLLARLLVSNFGTSDSIAKPLSYVILLFLFLIGVFIFSGLTTKFLESISLGKTNKFLGGIVGGLKYAFLISVILVVIKAFDKQSTFITKQSQSESFTYRTLIKLAPTIWEQTTNKTDDEKKSR